MNQKTDTTIIRLDCIICGDPINKKGNRVKNKSKRGLNQLTCDHKCARVYRGVYHHIYHHLYRQGKRREARELKQAEALIDPPSKFKALEHLGSIKIEKASGAD